MRANLRIFIYASQNASIPPLECRILIAVSVDCCARACSVVPAPAICSLSVFPVAIFAISTPGRYPYSTVPAAVHSYALNIYSGQVLVLLTDTIIAGRQYGPFEIRTSLALLDLTLFAKQTAAVVVVVICTAGHPCFDIGRALQKSNQSYAFHVPPLFWLSLYAWTIALIATLICPGRSGHALTILAKSGSEK